MPTENENNDVPPSFLWGIAVRAMAAAMDARQNNVDPLMRFYRYTDPSHARLLHARRLSEDEEARAVERANESEAFSSHRRAPGT